MTYNNADTPYYRSAIRQSKQGEPLLEKAKEDYESLDIDPRTGFLAVPIDQEIFSYNLVPFPKSEDDEESPIQADDLQASSLSTPADAESQHKRRRKRNDPTAEPPKASGRTLRGTPGRVSQGSSQPPTPNGDAKPSTPVLDQSPGIRAPIRALVPVRTAAPLRAIIPARSGAPVRTGLKPEAPKLKTATLTRADIAKTKGQTGEQVGWEAADQMLEKLKLKSKKSRTLANSLQSRLKPSIVDKAVVINKKAPKGWAYVVVEGEEDTTEGEDGEDEEKATSTRASSSTPAPGQSLPDPTEGDDADAANLEAVKRDESRRKGREKAIQKKLDREAKAKDRMVKYHSQKAEKARLLAETLARRARGEEVSEDEAEKKESSKPVVTTRTRRVAGKISVDVNPPALDEDAQRSQPGSPSVTKPQVNGGQKSVGSSPCDEAVEGIAGKRKAGSPEDTELQQDSSEKSTESNHKPATKRGSVSERPSKSKRRSHGDVEKHRLEEDGDANGGDKGEEESDAAERSEESEAVRAKDEPPRKRQKKAGLGRSSPPEELDDESGAGNPRRLRSQEAIPQAVNAAALGPRRSSLAGSKGNSTKGGVDSTSGEYNHQQNPAAV
ncbi:MAG: hypothetical protein JOS17DRAFT_249048 [Linnemannia elongata]|nr:MAG: hypothetical protein JOS17DRAFT_249048 [Linnemannia elongata]